jgi:hypothetical protein
MHVGSTAPLLERIAALEAQIERDAPVMRQQRQALADNETKIVSLQRQVERLRGALEYVKLGRIVGEDPMVALVRLQRLAHATLETP